jgi:hypothetical protein
MGHQWGSGASAFGRKTAVDLLGDGRPTSPIRTRELSTLSARLPDSFESMVVQSTNSSIALSVSHSYGCEVYVSKVSILICTGMKGLFKLSPGGDSRSPRISTASGASPSVNFLNPALYKPCTRNAERTTNGESHWNCLWV